MGKRQCPLCFVRVPWTALLARSYEVECPGCHAGLEASRYTRVFAGFGGIAGGWITMHLAGGLFPGAAWVTRMMAAILGFALASAACAFLAGDLVVGPKTHSSTFPHSAR